MRLINSKYIFLFLFFPLITHAMEGNAKKNDILTKINQNWGKNQCGICEKDNCPSNCPHCTAHWPNILGNNVHLQCLTLIQPAIAESSLLMKLYAIGDDLGAEAAHVYATDAVNTKIKKTDPTLTIKLFLEKNGPKALKELFDTDGIAAAEQFCFPDNDHD